jgi:hypothetical protein
MKLAKIYFAVVCAVLISQCVGSAQNLPGAPREIRGGTEPSMLPGRSDAERWNKVKDLIPKVIGMTKNTVFDTLGKSTQQLLEGSDGICWIYQITEYSKNPSRDEYLCQLLTISFQKDKAIKCAIEPQQHGR